MSRYEVALAIGLLVAVCILSSVQSGFAEVSVGVGGQTGLLAAVEPYRHASFCVAATAITLLGLLLEATRRRESASRELSNAGPSRLGR